MFKNEEIIKDLIVKTHRRGNCDSNGRSVRKMVDGKRLFTAKPRTLPLSAKTYVIRDGEMVLKDG